MLQDVDGYIKLNVKLMYKAILVVKEYTQLEGLDIFYTFSLIAKLTIVRLLLFVASINNWYL